MSSTPAGLWAELKWTCWDQRRSCTFLLVNASSSGFSFFSFWIKPLILYSQAKTSTLPGLTRMLRRPPSQTLARLIIQVLESNYLKGNIPLGWCVTEDGWCVRGWVKRLPRPSRTRSHEFTSFACRSMRLDFCFGFNLDGLKDGTCSSVQIIPHPNQDQRCQSLSPWKQSSKVCSNNPHCGHIQSDFRERSVFFFAALLVYVRSAAVTCADRTPPQILSDGGGAKRD